MNNDFTSAYFQSNGTNAYTTVDPQQISTGYDGQQNISTYSWAIPEQQTTSSNILTSTSMNPNNLSSPAKNAYPTPSMETNANNNFIQIQNTPVVGSNIRNSKSKLGVESTMKNVTNNTSHINININGNNRSPEYGEYKTRLQGNLSYLATVADEYTGNPRNEIKPKVIPDLNPLPPPRGSYGKNLNNLIQKAAQAFSNHKKFHHRPVNTTLPLNATNNNASFSNQTLDTSSSPRQYKVGSSMGSMMSSSQYQQQMYQKQQSSSLQPPSQPPSTQMPQQMSQQMPQQIMPQQMPQQIPQQMSQQISQQIPQQIPQQSQQIHQQMRQQQLSQQPSQQPPQQPPQQQQQQPPQQPPQPPQQPPQQPQQQPPQQQPQQPQNPHSQQQNIHSQQHQQPSSQQIHPQQSAATNRYQNSMLPSVTMASYQQHPSSLQQNMVANNIPEYSMNPMNSMITAANQEHSYHQVLPPLVGLGGFIGGGNNGISGGAAGFGNALGLSGMINNDNNM
ncbi:7381_t:CDS:2 [Dentiscutata erythropus]|uniref:7381_t:CDS:1 n=1 Tax=Dentiscutata erythropus TaxID=1348616 RepID=A0A9N9A028_9GLOM|nr:7381_t:CDS:2 [Dentiscutata erythropus]